MKNQIKTLKLMLTHKDEMFTIRKISKLLKINYRTAHDTIKELEKESLVSVKKAGNSKLCGLTFKFNAKIFEAEYERRSELFKNKDFLVLFNRLSELNFSFIALVFGSYAKNASNKYSDIDLLVIGDEQEKIKKVVELWPKKVHLTWVSYEEFLHMAKSREFTVVSEAIKNNIILLGIEEYYRLFKNVG